MTFSLISKKNIPSLQVELQYFKHDVTGAEHLHLASKNEENVFLVGLRTVPMDSTGIPHILEHLALCGSQRYPVRDPFFMMHRRSLNTFMNAFTSSDWTAYPFASQNKKDFHNLLEVYLDAVFFSRLDVLDFAQEGHRQEFTNPQDPSSDLVYKGVVFNEMKGAMSSTVSYLGDLLSKHLYTSTTYHFNSGGDPALIPKLTHEQLLAFYKKHYHPSNAMFMTFGDIPASEHQAHFEQYALSRFKKSTEVIDVANEPRLKNAKNVVEKYPAENNDPAQTYLIFSWLLHDADHYEDVLAAKLLSALLLDNSASPLLQALETTNLATAPLPGSLLGLGTENKQMSFTCGVQGSEAKHADAIEKLILDVFKKIANEGVPEEKIEAALHQLELSQREITGGSYPYGLQLILDCLPNLVHRRDPMPVLDVDHSLKQLRVRCENPNFIKELVTRFFLNNTHHVRLIAQPDVHLSEERLAEEKKELSTIKSKLSAQEKQKIIDGAEALKHRQEQDDDPDILPKIDIADIPASIFIASPAAKSKAITTFSAGTNGLIYQDVIMNLPKLSEEHVEILPYFTSCMTELGFGTCDYLEAQSRQAAVSGGLGCSTMIKTEDRFTENTKAFFIMNTKALVRNHEASTTLMKESLLSARFDEHDRIKDLLAQIRADSVKNITNSGHYFAMMAAARSCHPLAYYQHRQNGLMGIQHTCMLDSKIQDPMELKKLSQTFQAIHATIIKQPKEFLIVSEAEHLKTTEDHLVKLWPETTGEISSSFMLTNNADSKTQLWTLETEVNFCAKAYPVVGVYHADAPALTVLAAFLKQGFLHRVIREQGGAYGGGAAYHSGTHSFRFYSYRDPRLSETLSDFDNAIDWLASTKHSPEKLEEAIFDVMGGLDKPSSPAGEAKQAFYHALMGRLPEDIQKLRQDIIHTTMDDLLRVAAKYLTPKEGRVAIVTNRSAAEAYGEANAEILDFN